MNQVRNCKIKSFLKTIPDSRIRLSLSIIDYIILKFHDNDIEIINENFHDLRENIKYMISFEKLIKNNNGNLIIGDNNADE